MKVDHRLSTDGKKLPTELFKEREGLEEKLLNADDNTLGSRRLTAVARNNIDDEYNVDRYIEPKVMITTSRRPSQKLIQF